MSALSRRFFLQVSAASGGMLLGASLLGCKRRESARTEALAVEAPPAAESAELNAYVHIDSDDTITVTVPEAEMGQGILTAFAMIVAEELDADWTRVRARHAPVDPRYGNQSTGGSTSIRQGYETLRTMGAAARHLLVAAAAARWSVAAAELHTESSTVVHAASGRTLRYGELASDAAALTPPASPALKDKKDFRLIGTPVKRLDARPKIDGSAVYGIDVKREGMLVAQVARCPYVTGTLTSFDATAAQAVPGVRSVVEIPGGVAVVASDFWAAKRGRDALVTSWDPGAAKGLSSASITKTLRDAIRDGKVAHKNGDPDRALTQARSRLQAVYEVPYLAHTPMEPLSCTVELTSDRCDIWVSTQSPSRVQKVASDITGLPIEKISVTNLMLGGGFGRRAQVDFVQDALHTARAVGKPVKVIWSREDDVRGGFYRPVAYNELAGGLDAQGWPVAWIHRIASPSILQQLRPLENGVDPTSVEGAANLPYGIDNVLVTYANPSIPVSTWFWRSVGSSQNAYVTECFLDELARLGQKDPVEVRRRLLQEHPRHLRVLDTAAEKAGWGSPLPPGRARGVAVHESFGSIVAQVAEVSIDQGQVRVHRVVCAIDCGDVINPNTIEAQMESGIVYGLTAALHGRIDIQDGQVVQSNFHDYPALRLPEMPIVETYIVASGDALGGVGEPGTPPIAPAVCNALLALTGTPVRKLPIGALA